MKEKWKKFKYKKLLFVAAVLVLVVIGIRFALNQAAGAFLNKGQEAEYSVEAAQIRTVENYLSSSGTAQPLDTYSVTTISSVEGTVLSADFEEGDYVEEGQILYRISTDNLENKIASAQKSITRAEKKYKKAVEEYEEAKEGLEDLEVKAETTGYIKALHIEAGDEIQAKNTALAEIYNNKTMVLEVPFLASDVSEKQVGKKAVVEMSESGEEVEGIVTEVSSLTETLSGNRLVHYVTIEVENPGAIAEGALAAAYIGDKDCCEEGTFTLYSNGSVYSAISGEIEAVYVKKGDWVEKGDVLCKLSQDTVEKDLENYQDQIDTALESLENAEDSLEEIYDTQADYTITSPISGTIIKKNTKAGDTVSANNNSALCLIYDLSAMTFEMYVDELDVMNVEVGQTVNITADALPEESFEGVITNVSLVSISSGGVTQYPVTVQIDEVGSLLPGMNISGEIVIESVENVLTVPADAVMRGNVVYVQDTEKETQTDKDAEKEVGKETEKEAGKQEKTQPASDSEKEGKTDISDKEAEKADTSNGVPEGFHAVSVEVGVSDGSYIEIISGLDEGAMVYVPARAESQMQMMMPGGMQGGDMPDGNMGNAPSGGGGRDNNGGGRPNGNNGPSGGF